MRTATLTYKIYVEGRQSLYFDCFDLVSKAIKEHINGSFAIYVNGIKVDLSFPNKDSNGLLYLGTFEDCNVSIDVDANFESYCSSYGVFGLSLDKLEQLIDNAPTADLEVDGGNITGTANSDKDGQYLYLSVPYDSGFSATVNGKSAEIFRTMTGFMAVKLDKGENDISLSFSPKGLKEGAVLCLVGIVCLVLYIIFRKKVAVISQRFDGICRVGIYVLLCAVLLAVYVLPMILSIIGNICSLF